MLYWIISKIGQNAHKKTQILWKVFPLKAVIVAKGEQFHINVLECDVYLECNVIKA